MNRPAVVTLVLLAAVLCLANTLKPLTVDDAVYYEYARHLAGRPLDPYGFTLGPGGPPANQTLAPVGFLYWWGAVYAVVGEWPLGWKLGLAPVCLLLVFSLAELARRFAPGREVAVVAVTVLSPAVLAGLNLMLDVPALALGLAAVAVFLRACDGGRWSLALAAGLLAGLAMQTKYTAFVVPALFAGAGWLYGRPALGLAAAALAVLLFAGWEVYLAGLYGESHFLIAVGQRNGPLADKLKLVLPLVGILGGTAGAVGLVALAGLGGSRRLGYALAAGVVGAYLLVAFVPEGYATLLDSGKPGRSVLNVNSLAFGSVGLLLLGLGGCVACALLRDSATVEKRRAALLLLGWLALEALGYLALSPFPAVRRVLGLVVVGTLAAGSLAARQGRTPRTDALFRLAVCVSAMAGLVGFAADAELYRADRSAARQAARWARDHDARATTWVNGIGAFEYYARRHGARRLDVADAAARPGDLLLVPVLRYGLEVTTPPGPGWEERTRFRLGSPLPLRSCFQWGGTALAHAEGPLVEVAVYRRSGEVTASRPR